MNMQSSYFKLQFSPNLEALKDVLQSKSELSLCTEHKYIYQNVQYPKDHITCACHNCNAL